jgi:hypothetical protein
MHCGADVKPLWCACRRPLLRNTRRTSLAPLPLDAGNRCVYTTSMPKRKRVLAAKRRGDRAAALSALLKRAFGAQPIAVAIPEASATVGRSAHAVRAGAR